MKAEVKLSRRMSETDSERGRVGGSRRAQGVTLYEGCNDKRQKVGPERELCGSRALVALPEDCGLTASTQCQLTTVHNFSSRKPMPSFSLRDTKHTCGADIHNGKTSRK